MTRRVIHSDKTSMRYCSKAASCSFPRFGMCPEKEDSTGHLPGRSPFLLTPGAQSPSSPAQGALQLHQLLCTQAVLSYSGEQVLDSCYFTALNFLQQLSVISFVRAYGGVFLGYFVVTAAGNLTSWGKFLLKGREWSAQLRGQVHTLFSSSFSSVKAQKKCILYDLLLQKKSSSVSTALLSQSLNKPLYHILSLTLTLISRAQLHLGFSLHYI